MLTADRRWAGQEPDEVRDMLVTPNAHVVQPDEGPVADLGAVQMRLLAGSLHTGSTFALAEFSGASAGAWTVPHRHEVTQESFYVIDGLFTFTVGDETVEAGPGAYVLV